MYKSNSAYKVRHNRNYLVHLCEELIYGVKFGRDKFNYSEEGLYELKKYRDYIYDTKLNIPNEERTDLELSLEWIVSCMIYFIEGKVVGDLVPPLSLAKKTIMWSKNLNYFSWVDMQDNQSVYIFKKERSLNPAKIRRRY